MYGGPGTVGRLREIPGPRGQPPPPKNNREGAVQISTMPTPRRSRRPYLPPAQYSVLTLRKLDGGVREIPGTQQQRFGFSKETPEGPCLWVVGDTSLVRGLAVSIVGSRKVSPEGRKRTRRLARALAEAGVTVVSGLAEGVDTEAHWAAIDAGGRTVAVIGTPLDRAYPASNAKLQELIYREHLLVSQFEPGSRVFPSNFPARNKTMAALSDATVIIEASDTSGTLHQASECTRIGRWLFIARSVVENTFLTWPKRFLGRPKVAILDRVEDVLDAIREERRCP